MKKNSIILPAFLSVFVMLVFFSCKKEFVADDETFANFTSWSLVATESFPGSAALGAMAHGAADSTAVRTIYFQDNAVAEDGEYPVETLIGKQIVSDAGTSYFGMAKRGKDFNPDQGDWEWFILNADGSVSERGGGDFKACGGCHASATTDFVFSK